MGSLRKHWDIKLITTEKKRTKKSNSKRNEILEITKMVTHITKK